MNSFRLITTFVLLLSTTALFSQIHNRLHWVFPADSVEQITFDLYSEYTVAHWEGNQIMASSEITVHNANKSIMKFFIEEDKRYDIVDTLQGTQLLIESLHSRRAPIQSKGQTCYEIIKIKILVPTTFVKQDEHIWVKKEEEVEED